MFRFLCHTLLFNSIPNHSVSVFSLYILHLLPPLPNSCYYYLRFHYCLLSFSFHPLYWSKMRIRLLLMSLRSFSNPNNRFFSPSFHFHWLIPNGTTCCNIFPTHCIHYCCPVYLFVLPFWRRMAPRCRQGSVHCSSPCECETLSGWCPLAVHTCRLQRRSRFSCQRETVLRTPKKEADHSQCFGEVLILQKYYLHRFIQCTVGWLWLKRYCNLYTNQKFGDSVCMPVSLGKILNLELLLNMNRWMSHVA